MKKYNNFLKSTPIFLAFLVMGFGDVSGPLTSQLQSDFSLNNFQAGLVTFMAFIMFGLLSIPMGLYQDRKGRKHQNAMQEPTVLSYREVAEDQKQNAEAVEGGIEAGEFL